MLKTHATVKYTFKKCILKIIVVETRFEKEKNNVTISTRDFNTSFCHRFNDSQIDLLLNVLHLVIKFFFIINIIVDISY